MEVALGELRGTEVRKAPRWESLSARAERLRLQVNPELEKLRAKREEEARKREEAERKREEQARRLEAAREERQRRLEAAREAAAEAQRGSAYVRCNDGTYSPSCLCSRASFRGCCSHHGGVDGCY